jgi:hypothetical protein
MERVVLKEQSMVFRRFLNSDNEDDAEEYREPTLDTMQVGYMVDYDLQTWEVAGYGTYDYDGFTSHEWELRASQDLHFLECSKEDGRLQWTLTSAVVIGEIEGDVANAIQQDGDPPETLIYAGKTYKGTESGGGLYREKGEGDGREFVSWSFEATGGHLLYINQWGETEFSAFAGQSVEEYQFTDILPVVQES